MTDVSSAAIRCYELSPGTGAASTTSVAAGGSVSFKITPNIFHQGPLQFYMAKVPSGKTAANWDGSGNVWFKIYAEKANVANGQLTWNSLNAATASVTIPKNTPSGEYLLRVEHIALHSASAINGAQIYISCAQVKVTGQVPHHIFAVFPILTVRQWWQWDTRTACCLPGCLHGGREGPAGQHLWSTLHVLTIAYAADRN